MSLVDEMPLAATAAALRENEINLKEYIDKICRNIEEKEEELAALIIENSWQGKVKKQVKKLLDNFPEPTNRPELFGVPVAAKDVFHIDGYPTRAGSKLNPSDLQGEEGYTVTKLREAGAIFLPKAVTTEFAWFKPGPTRNPHNTSHTPGGSSSGSAAAVAAGYCPLALGTQTYGSVIRPAAYCGIIGFKPTQGRIPLEGLLANAPSVDHIGFFTQDIEGIDLAAEQLCRNWQSRIAAKEKGHKKPRLAVPEGNYLEQATSKGLAVFARQQELLKASGYEIIKVSALDNIAEIMNQHQTIVAYEFSNMHEDLYSQNKELYSSYVREIIEEGQQVNEEKYQQAKLFKKELQNEVRELQKQREIDIWISPAAPGSAPEGLDNTGDPAMNLPWTSLGFPALTIPAGKSEQGLPYGLQLTADLNRDEEMVYAAAILAELLVS